MKLSEQLIADRKGCKGALPKEPSKQLIKEIKERNIKGERFLCWYKSLDASELAWLKENGITVKAEYDRNDTLYHITWK